MTEKKNLYICYIWSLIICFIIIFYFYAFCFVMLNLPSFPNFANHLVSIYFPSWLKVYHTRNNYNKTHSTVTTTEHPHFKPIGWLIILFCTFSNLKPLFLCHGCQVPSNNKPVEKRATQNLLDLETDLITIQQVGG